MFLVHVVNVSESSDSINLAPYLLPVKYNPSKYYLIIIDFIFCEIRKEKNQYKDDEYGKQDSYITR